MSNLDSVRTQLLENNDDFRRLYEEHRDCKQYLADMRQKSGMPTQEDEVEIKRLKLRKLSLKDRMEAIVREQGMQASA